jgi:hypothetical protein
MARLKITTFAMLLLQNSSLETAHIYIVSQSRISGHKEGGHKMSVSQLSFSQEGFYLDRPN